MTKYQKLRAYLAGKRQYRAVRHNSDRTLSVRQFYASSIEQEQAQAKFPDRIIYRLCFSISYSRKYIKRFYWRAKWINCMIYEYSREPKLYRWGYWNFSLPQKLK